MRTSGIVVTAALTLLAAAAAGAQSVQQVVAAEKGAVEAAQLIELEATVVAIDLDSRVVKLRSKEGKELEVTAGPQVQRLADVRVGDVVSVEFYESLTLALSKVEGGSASRSEVSAEARTEATELPGGIKARQTTIVAKVTAIDTTSSSVTVQGPGGRSVALEVDPEVLKQVKVGDLVNAIYTEALAVAVSRPGAE